MSWNPLERSELEPAAPSLARLFKVFTTFCFWAFVRTSRKYSSSVIISEIANSALMCHWYRHGTCLIASQRCCNPIRPNLKRGVQKIYSCTFINYAYGNTPLKTNAFWRVWSCVYEHPLLHILRACPRKDVTAWRDGQHKRRDGKICAGKVKNFEPFFVRDSNSPPSERLKSLNSLPTLGMSCTLATYFYESVLFLHKPSSARVISETLLRPIKRVP